MTDDDKALVSKIRSEAELQKHYDGLLHMQMTLWADCIEALSAENERLNTLINETGVHWLALQNDHPIIWEGAIDAAMKAACDEIRLLREALERIGDELSTCAADDCENGVSSLNERAASSYLKEYPHTAAAIKFAIDTIRAALGEKK